MSRSLTCRKVKMLKEQYNIIGSKPISLTFGLSFVHIYYINTSIKGPLRYYLPTIGIRAHDGVRQGDNLMKVPFADGVWGPSEARWQPYKGLFCRWSGDGPFAVGARDGGCVYLELTQVYIAQSKPNKIPHTDLGKKPNKESCQRY